MCEALLAGLSCVIIPMRQHSALEMCEWWPDLSSVVWGGAGEVAKLEGSERKVQVTGGHGGHRSPGGTTCGRMGALDVCEGEIRLAGRPLPRPGKR